MELVDEQDQVRVVLRLVDDGLETLFEVAAVFRARDDGRDVQGEDLLLRQGGGDLARGDTEGDTLDDGGFADAGVADEHRVVLLAPAENLDDPGDLHVPADDRIELPLAGRLRQVMTELADIEFLLFRFALGRHLFLVFPGGTDLRLLRLVEQAFVLEVGEDAAVVDAMVAEEDLAVTLRRPAEREEQVVRGGLRAFQSRRLHHRDAQDVLGQAGEIDVVQFVVGDGRAREDAAVDEGLQFRGVDPEPLQGAERRVLLMADDAEEQVVGPDAVAAGPHGLLPGVFDDAVEFFRNFDFHIAWFLPAKIRNPPEYPASFFGVVLRACACIIHGR